MVNDKYHQHILPMIASSKNGTQRLKSMTNYYSPFYTPESSKKTTIKDHEEIILTCQDSIKQFDTIDIVPLYNRDAKIWNNSLSKIGFKCHIYHHSTNWYHDNISCIDQYWSLRSKKLIKSIKSSKNKLNKLGGYSTSINQEKDTKDLKKRLSHYHQVYYNSWKQAEPYPEFIDSICQHAWMKNELRLGIIYHNDLPVAAQIWFVNDKTAYIFKLAYRTSYQNTSIGTLLTAAMIEHVIGIDKVTFIDFLTGNDDFKKKWMSSSRPLMGIQGCNPNTITGRYFDIINKLSRIRRKVGI